MGPLLKYSPNMSIRSISSQDERSHGVRMLQEDRRGQGRLGLLEGSNHGRCPLQMFQRPLESISERPKEGSSTGNETPIKIKQAKKALEVLN